MKIKLLVTAFIIHFICLQISAQAYYMHEAAEDSDGDPIGGVVGTLLIFGIIWVIGKCLDSYSESKEKTEQMKWKMNLLQKVMEERLKKNPNKYRYQNNQYWRQGYLKAYYQITNSIQDVIFYNKTIDELLSEYQKIDTKSKEARKIMREIGYYQFLEWNNELLVNEGKSPIKMIKL